MKRFLLILAAGIQLLAVQGMLEALGNELDWADIAWAMTLLTTALASLMLAFQKD